MKIVIQRGDIVNREDVTYLFEILPSETRKLVNSFTVYASRSSEAEYKYYDKEKTFGFFSPVESSLTKDEAVSNIAARLLAVAEIGHLPDKLSKSKLEHYKSTWTVLCSSNT